MLIVTLVATAFAAPTLTMDGTCPGPVTIDVTGVTGPGVAFLAGPAEGSDALAGGLCRDTVTELSSPRMITGLRDHDGDGTLSFSPVLPGGACTQVVQVIDIGDCSVSDMLDLDEPAGPIDSELDYVEIDPPHSLRDFDVAADGTTHVVSTDGGNLWLTCYAPDGTDLYGALDVGDYSAADAVGVFTSRVSKHVLVVWRDYMGGPEELKYSYLDENCAPLVTNASLFFDDYFEFFDAQIDDSGRATVAVSDGHTDVAFLDAAGGVIRTERAFDIGASYGTHVAMNQSTGGGIVAAQIHSGDGIYYRRFDADFNWTDPAEVRMVTGNYHYWYDGFTLGMNDRDEFVFLWRSAGTQIDMAFYDAAGVRVADVARVTPDFEGWDGGHCYDSFRLRHQEIPLNGDNFVLGEVYNWIAGDNLWVQHFEYTPAGGLVSESGTDHTVDEGLTIRTDGVGNAVVRDSATLQTLYDYP